MAKVKHDHIVVIYDVGTDRDVAFLAMEFLEGESLDQWLERGGVPSIPEAVRIVREVAEGLAAAHEAGLIHRDIKPGNIWLEKVTGAEPRGRDHSPRVKLLDFGLARSADEDIHLTQSGMVVGTPSYMSPEQARGQALDARSDLFSLGVLLYRLCAGRQPFRGPTTVALLTALATETPLSVREVNPAVPPALADLTMRLLAKRPADRPHSAGAVVEALRGLEDRPAAPPPPPTIDIRKPARAPLPKEPASERTAVPVQTVPLPVTPPEKKPRRTSWAVSIASMLAGAAVVGLTAFLLFGPGLRRGEQAGGSGERGTLRVECDEEKVEAVLEGSGAEVLLSGLKATPSWDRTLEAGSYRLRLVRPRKGLEAEPERFTIRAGETTVVTIRRVPQGKTDPPGVPLEARLVANQATYALDLGGQTAEEFRQAIQAGADSGRYPPPPRVDLVLEFRNTGTRDLQVKTGGTLNAVTLDLRGPGAVSVKLQKQITPKLVVASQVLTLAPGKSASVPITSLSYGVKGSDNAYWTEAGEYTLTAGYQTAVAPGPRDARAGPDGFTPVTVTSAPIKIKVTGNQ
jgi:hypothetical protein